MSTWGPGRCALKGDQGSSPDWCWALKVRRVLPCAAKGVPIYLPHVLSQRVVAGSVHRTVMRHSIRAVEGFLLQTTYCPSYDGNTSRCHYSRAPQVACS